MIWAALTPPLLPRARRTCCGNADVCVRPPTVISDVLPSPEQGGEEAKAREGSKSPWRRRRGAARLAFDNASPDAWLHTRLRSDAKPHCGIAADANRPRPGRLPSCDCWPNDAPAQALRGRWPPKYKNFWQMDPRRPRRTRRHAPAAARTRRPWDGLPGVAVGGSDNGSCRLRFFWPGAGAGRP